MTHNGAVEIIIAVQGDKPVQCVGLYQVAGHHTRGVVIEMGPVVGPGCGMPGDGHVQAVRRVREGGVAGGAVERGR